MLDDMINVGPPMTAIAEYDKYLPNIIKKLYPNGNYQENQIKQGGFIQENNDGLQKVQSSHPNNFQGSFPSSIESEDKVKKYFDQVSKLKSNVKDGMK